MILLVETDKEIASCYQYFHKCGFQLTDQVLNSSSEMRDYYVHSENFTENEPIIDHVHESREIN